MAEPFDALSGEERDLLRKTDLPEKPSPMLATLTHDHFSDPDWIFERKWDGERALLRYADGSARLLTRKHNDISDTYPEIVEAAEASLAVSALLDGEIVAFDGDVSSFSRLQKRMQLSGEEARCSDVAVYYYVFDLPWLDGRSLADVPLRSRKKVLQRAVDFSNRIRFTQHRNEDGEAYLEEACKKGWEGLIAKKAASGYVHSRSKSWLKFKCTGRQEFVIGGFTPPEGERIRFGALLLGYYGDDELRYAGKVGTGFDDDLLKRLGDRLEDLRIDTSPFSGEVSESDACWVRPELVCEVGFTEWTDDGKLRHPRFKGLRQDKDPRDVVRE